MAIGRSRPPDRNGMDGDPEIRIREIRIFRKFFFRFFSLLRTSWDLRVTPRMFRYHLIRIRTGKSGFSKIRIFRFFDFLSLKTLQYGCLWTPLDQPKSPVPVPQYRGSSTSVLVGSRGVHRHPYCWALSLKKAKRPRGPSEASGGSCGGRTPSETTRGQPRG